MAIVTTKDTNLTSVYHFAPTVGMRAQQLYSSIKNGSFPRELYVYQATPSGGQQPMVKVAEAKEYFATKNAAKESKVVEKIVENPAMIADAFITLIEKDNAKLGAQVRKWWNTKNAATPEGKQ